MLGNAILCQDALQHSGPFVCLNMHDILSTPENKGIFKHWGSISNFENTVIQYGFSLKACMIPQPHKHAGQFLVVDRNEDCPDPFSLE